MPNPSELLAKMRKKQGLPDPLPEPPRKPKPVVKSELKAKVAPEPKVEAPKPPAPPTPKKKRKQHQSSESFRFPEGTRFEAVQIGNRWHATLFVPNEAPRTAVRGGIHPVLKALGQAWFQESAPEVQQAARQAMTDYVAEINALNATKPVEEAQKKWPPQNGTD